LHYSATVFVARSGFFKFLYNNGSGEKYSYSNPAINFNRLVKKGLQTDKAGTLFAKFGRTLPPVISPENQFLSLRTDAISPIANQ
jgi:hypothetical protein